MVALIQAGTWMALRRSFVLVPILVCCTPILGVSEETPAPTVTITDVHISQRIVTVRNDATGAQESFHIETAQELQSLKVGQILTAPAVQPRSSQNAPPTKADKDQQGGGGCYEQCRRAGSAILECLYWCANR